MAELTTTNLNAEQHLLLDQPLLRMPYELSRKNFALVRREVERDTTFATKLLSSATNPSDPLATLDSMLTRMTGLKRKLENLRDEELTIQKHSRARMQHLQELYSIPSLADVKYDDWSRVRLNRLIVDYMLRNGYAGSAKQLAEEKRIEALVDVDAFVACHRIEASLRKHDTKECLAWCQDNNKELKKINSNLVFELRLQQFIEYIRSNKKAEAVKHAQKFLSPHADFEAVKQATVLLVVPPDTPTEPYSSFYHPSRWSHLADLFVKTHYQLFNLPARPLLHIALTAGLSAIKTPACHSQYASSTANASSSATSLCPICSTELNELARNVPYAHHTKSHTEEDPVCLPNGRVYGKERLLAVNRKLGMPAGKIRDPTDMTKVYDVGELKKVFIM